MKPADNPVHMMLDICGLFWNACTESDENPDLIYKALHAVQLLFHCSIGHHIDLSDLKKKNGSNIIAQCGAYCDLVMSCIHHVGHWWLSSSAYIDLLGLFAGPYKDS